MSSLSNRLARGAAKSSKTSEGLKFSAGKLRNLEKITVDPVVSALLTKIGGEISLSITGQASTVIVKVTEHDGSKTAVTLEEFLKVISATNRVGAIVKECEAMKSSNEIRDTIANYVFAFNISEADLLPLNAETYGLIKQSMRVVEKVEENRLIAGLLVRKFPNDPMGLYLQTTLDLVFQTVIGGTVALVTRRSSVSESNSELCERYALPVWSLRKFTSDKLNKDASPYSIFFPRNKAKGITCTTAELRRDTFKAANTVLLANSSFLVGLIQEQRFLDYFVPVTELIADSEANQHIFTNHGWSVLPLLEESVDRFLELKQKVVADCFPDAPKADFKKRLAKLGNAILRTSLLENSGFKSHIVICGRFFPNSHTEFNPMKGVNMYEALQNEPGVEEAVNNFYRPTDATHAEMWGELTCLELKMPYSAAIRAATRSIFNIPQGLPIVNPSVVLLQNNTIVRFPQLVKEGFVKEGSPHLQEVVGLKTKLFTLVDDDEKTGKKKSSRIVSFTTLGKRGKSVVSTIEKGIGKKPSVKVRDFLCGFSCDRLQDEAANRIAAVSNQSLEEFFEDVDAVESDSDETE